MASEKAARILQKKEAPFSEEQILAMPEGDAWAWIYAQEKERREKRDHGKLPQVCFTGFTDSEKERLKLTAQQVGLEVKDSVTKGCVLLITGSNVGPSKLKKAEEQGCLIVDENGFIEFVRTI